ncbi:hypothetical protein BGZ76_005755 [Entomortierella beljakovae]|nr:hypothetical protein BGZ76_005755 [Entomortierella beljakovae]
MDSVSMAFMTDNGFFDDCDQSVFPSGLPSLIANTSVPGAEQIMANNSFSFPSNDLASVSWDMMPSKLDIEQFVSSTTSNMPMEFATPDLSPATSLATPAVYNFDVLALDELGSSPSMDWHSPFEASFGSHSQEGLELDLLMSPTPADNDTFVYGESPMESDFDCYSPLDSAAGSPFIGDCSGLFGTSDDTAGDVDRCGSGIQPMKRRRRRRITTEEDARVIPEDCKDDPNARARYKCNVCDKTFSRPFNLRSHRATHAGVKPFTCAHVSETGEVCEWSFARRHDLERHTRSRHSREKLFKCKTCGAECGRNDAFKRHLQRHQACRLAALMEQQGRDANMDGA